MLSTSRRLRSRRGNGLCGRERSRQPSHLDVIGRDREGWVQSLQRAGGYPVEADHKISQDRGWGYGSYSR